LSDLFTDDLSKLTLSDVIDFLGINGPEELRPPEGTRIDFKRVLVPDLGATVCAFANTFGGVVFLGVESSKHTKPRQNVALSVPGTPLGSDARARITNLIVSTVNPRPRFEVQPYGTDNSGNMVAVVRVEDGTNPPYEFERTGSYQIPIRVQDTTRQASLREIEDLLAKRTVLQAGVDQQIALYLRDADAVAPGDSQRMLIVPHSALRLRLDSNFERGFVEMAGGRARLPAIVRRGAFFKFTTNQHGFRSESIATRLPR
jgi:predicted HTH transcriptional regulator